MLQSFRGTFDAVGIRTLRVELDNDRTSKILSETAEFWAVIDVESAQRIRVALARGDRVRATRLLSEMATTVGSILPT